MTEKRRARIGMVNFINTAPLYETWKDIVHRSDWHVEEATPATLNRMLNAGQLDLGFVSSHEYALHPQNYRILGNLSISATGSVGSVFLFSRQQLAELDESTLLLSGQSQTSNYLIKILLEEFYKVKPHYKMPVHENGNSHAQAVLAIGDQALRLKQEGSFPYIFDLSKLWQNFTGLPFVFAVWAVREEFCRADMDTVIEIHQTLLRCVKKGAQNLYEISCRVAPRIPMQVDECHSYLQRIEFDLNAEKEKALQLFYRYLIERKEADPHALPLKVCGLAQE